MRTYLVYLLLFVVACSQIGQEPSYNTSCITTEVFEVRGTSMHPLIPEGSNLTVLMGFQECNNLSRGDVILYTYGGKSNPLLKQIKAVPGDTWNLGNDTIIVNGEILKNSIGHNYRLGAQGLRRLPPYLEDYPLLKEGQYLILGDNIANTLDSREFGLVSNKDMLGIVDPRSYRKEK